MTKPEAQIARALSGTMGIRSSLAKFVDPYLQARERLRAYDVYLSAMLILAASRFVVIVGINFGTLLVRIPNPKHWDAGSAWYHRLLRWDSGWYAAIVSDGYQCCDCGPFTCGECRLVGRGASNDEIC